MSDYVLLRGEPSRFFLVRSVDGYISEFPDTDSDVAKVVQGLQRVIDTVQFYPPGSDLPSLVEVASFNHYTPDYVDLSQVKVLG